MTVLVDYYLQSTNERVMKLIKKLEIVVFFIK